MTDEKTAPARHLMFEVGQKVACIHDGHRVLVRCSGVVTRVLKTHLEVERTGSRQLFKYQLDGRDEYPRKKGPFVTSWERIEPWTKEHSASILEEKNRNRAKTLDVRKLSREQLIELVALMEKWEV